MRYCVTIVCTHPIHTQLDVCVYRRYSFLVIILLMHYCIVHIIDIIGIYYGIILTNYVSDT